MLLWFIKLQIKKVENETILKVEVIACYLRDELAMANSLINRCCETSLRLRRARGEDCKNGT